MFSTFFSNIIIFFITNIPNQLYARLYMSCLLISFVKYIGPADPNEDVNDAFEFALNNNVLDL